ncbi:MULTISPECIES: ester cyclase [unclassified Geodermatophilus]
MSADVLIAIAEQWTAADDAGDFSRHAEWMYPDTEIHLVSRGRVLRGPQEWIAFMRVFRAGVSDLHTTVLDRFATEDRLAHRWTLTGTHTGDFFGMPPTGRRIRVEGASVWSCRDGRPERIFVYSTTTVEEAAEGGSTSW